ncbi:hypothetical protein M758_9G087000 [Ceratodon purpureus]|nr:hypothetical protein M758_9G087000 [Ceratodon purpureus]
MRSLCELHCREYVGVFQRHRSFQMTQGFRIIPIHTDRKHKSSLNNPAHASVTVGLTNQMCTLMSKHHTIGPHMKESNHTHLTSNWQWSLTQTRNPMIRFNAAPIQKEKP